MIGIMHSPRPAARIAIHTISSLRVMSALICDREIFSIANQRL
jgi:hypothetical protein